MRILRVDVPLKKHKELNIYPIGDIHFNSPAFIEDLYNNWCNIVKNDKHAKCIILGDIIDEDRPSTRKERKLMFGDRPEAYYAEDKQHKYFLDHNIIPKYLSILNKDNCLGMIDGDHHRLYVDGLTSTQYICSKLGVPYLGDGQAIISLSFRDAYHGFIYNMHIRHGRGYNAKLGGTLNRNLDFQEKIRNIDCFIRGHSHNAMINSYYTYEFDDRKLRLNDKLIWILNVGSFRGGYIQNEKETNGITDYAELKEYGNSTREQVKLTIMYENKIERGRILIAKGQYV